MVITIITIFTMLGLIVNFVIIVRVLKMEIVPTLNQIAENLINET
jgi:hypothetical protein